MTSIRNYLGAGAAAAIFALAGNASAGIVTFDSFRSPTTIPAFGSHYAEAGLNFDVFAEGGAPEQIGSYGYLSATLADADPAGAAIFVNASSAKITITKSGGGTFFFNSIDLTDASNGLANRLSYDVVYDYVDAGGSHSGVFALDNAQGLQTFTVNLSDVTSFTMHTGNSNANQGPGVQLDNVRFNESLGQPGGAPEPAAWALMLLGFGGMGAMLRRRRTAMA
jgi:hypothetical protein